jgi:hypothetical protein
MKHFRHALGSHHKAGVHHGHGHGHPRHKIYHGTRRHPTGLYPGIEFMPFPFGYGLPGL